ncbi:hypothetical protein BC828DRAFT_379875 [Blastocladiella britannica]|nr:hypothetical protein BC828DRAFT_379875 [Blastocladiella britannica]
MASASSHALASATNAAGSSLTLAQNAQSPAPPVLSPTSLAVFALPEVVAASSIDDAELIVSSLVEEILQRSQDVLFEKHISSQVVPYAVQFAKDAMNQLIMWEFFDQDRLDPADPIWIPDTEPEPLEFDSWARGVVPIRPTLEDRPDSAYCLQSPSHPGAIAPPSKRKPIVRWNHGKESETVAEAGGASPTRKVTLSAAAELSMPPTPRSPMRGSGTSSGKYYSRDISAAYSARP